jgi:hypothetical protein
MGLMNGGKRIPNNLRVVVLDEAELRNTNLEGNFSNRLSLFSTEGSNGLRIR